MNILHLLSQNHLTGAEVYAATLAKQQLLSGNRVYQVSNDFFYESPSVKIKREVETRSKIEFLQNVFWLRNFIQKENLQVVHCHSRAASKLGYWATLGTKTALISSVHGVQHISISKKLFNQYGRIIAVCENVKAQLLADFSYRPESIQVIPNPISAQKYYPLPRKTSGQVKKIAIVGRSTGPKKVRTEQVIKSLLSASFSESFSITLIGGELQSLNLTAEQKNRITALQIKELDSDIYAEFDLIIGSGRVCMEALITGVPVIAFGEATYCGLVTAAGFKNALVSNFGDILPGSTHPSLPEQHFISDVKQALVMTQESDLSQMAAAEFSLEDIGRRVQRLYESAYFLKHYSKWIPVLMYHKIPNTEINSRHKIFVTKNCFERHLRFFKKRGLTTLSFNELAEFKSGKKSFDEFPAKPLLLTFDDGYLDNLEFAAPLLKKYGFNAQIFLLADASIKSNNWDSDTGETPHEIVAGNARQAWLESPFKIGSHGYSHQKITAMNPTEALTELRESKNALENEFKIKVPVYAFTYGITGENSAELAEKAGYDYAVNTDSGGLLLEEAPYSIFRVNIFPDESTWSLFKKTSTWYRRYYYFKRKK